MKRIRLLVALVLCASLRAQAPDSQPAHLPGEPHHHLKLENSYVRAYYVEVAPHDATQLHQHDLDYVYVSLGPADIINGVRGKPELHQVLKDGEIHFARGGLVHLARNLSDAPFRNLTIEFLHPQGELQNSCAAAGAGTTIPCQFWQGPGYRAEVPFVTGEVNALLVRLEPHARYAVEKVLPDTLMAALEGSSIRIDRSSTPAVLVRSATVFWVPAGSPPSFTNLQDEPSRFLLISFKDSAPAPHQTSDRRQCVSHGADETDLQVTSEVRRRKI